MASVSGSDAPDLFELLRGYCDRISGDRFSERELRDQVATLIIAGHETTAAALFWSFDLLALSPQWQERVAEEAAAHDLDPEGAADALSSLAIARAVVQEALRLTRPHSSSSGRRGLPIVSPAATCRPEWVMIAPWVLHRHRRLWQKS